MGLYLEFDNAEKWLYDNGKYLGRHPIKYEEKHPDEIWICLINNGTWNAAAICYNRDEYNRFLNDGTMRPRVWFLVHIDKLQGLIPDHHMRQISAWVTRWERRGNYELRN